MAIAVNGRQEEYVEGETVQGLLRRLNYVFPLVVVKVGDRVISKGDYDTTKIPDGETVAILHLTSGG